MNFSLDIGFYLFIIKHEKVIIMNPYTGCVDIYFRVLY
jgi:hypothetical protein